MSRTRYRWWGYVRGMIQLYPRRVEELRRRQSARITAQYGSQPAGSREPGRSTEDLATVSMGRHVDMEMEAVRLALEDLARRPNAEARRQLIELYHFQRSHTLAGAAAAIGVSEPTVRRWNAEFIYDVARRRDLTD